jgi:hypothetical protein
VTIINYNCQNEVVFFFNFFYADSIINYLIFYDTIIIINSLKVL